MQSLTGKVALITGAGRTGGIGAAVARRLAQDGADIVVADLCAPPTELPHAGSGRWEELAALAGDVQALGVRSLPLRVDVSNAESVQAMVAQVRETLGRLDILVNNAGVAVGPAPVLGMADEAWRRTLEINATPPWLVSQSGIVAEIVGKFGGADQLHNVMFYTQPTLRSHFRRTRDLLLPRLLSGQVNLAAN